jgi:hypothetical protein
MTSVKPLFCLLVIWLFASPAFAAHDDSTSQPSAGSVQNQTADSALFGVPTENQPVSSDLFFLKARPRLNLSPPAERPRSAVLNDADCYTMRMYKVKRKERFADGESGLRGYSTCELASNYQVRTAIVHVRTAEDADAQMSESEK